MNKNVGGRDRTARIGLGLVAVIAMMVVLFFQEAIGDRVLVTIVATIFLVLAFVFLGTAAAEKCPISHVLGRNTYEDSTGEE